VVYGTGRSAGGVAWIVGVVAVVLTAVFFAFPAAPVEAHTALEASSPKNDGKFGVAPAQVVLKFTEPILTTNSRVVVQGPDGVDYHAGAARIAGDQLTQPLKPLGPAGQYRIRFRVVAADGHPLAAGMRFTLTKPGPSAGGAKADDRPIALAPVYSTSGSVYNAPAWAPWLGGGFAVVLLSGAVWFGRRATRDLD
jgi:copper resistance protein C